MWQRYAVFSAISVALTVLLFPLVSRAFFWALETSQTLSAYAYYAFIVFAFGTLVVHSETIRPSLLFAWNCFLKPFLGKTGRVVGSTGSKPRARDEHQNRLESFYEGQADIYDVTRRRLLRGRKTMLRLCAAQLKQIYFYDEDFEHRLAKALEQRFELVPTPPKSPYLRPLNGNGGNNHSSQSEKKIVWIDIGGGTGWNIEQMNSYIPIQKFHKVYLVDITPSLCDIAKTRFAALGWSNVEVLCMDALEFNFVEEPDVEVGLITMSYALSMIPSIYPIVDKVSSLLGKNGVFGVADFYSSGKYSPADPTRQHSYLFRWFWQIWFDLDNVYLHPSRREYLEHKFVTVKCMNALNRFIGMFVKIPFYIWIGAQPSSLYAEQLNAAKSSNVEMSVLSLDNNGNVDETQNEFEKQSTAEVVKQLEIKTQRVKPLPIMALTEDHVHGVSTRWRLPFDNKYLTGFSTYIYAFAWEDPKVDLEHLDLNADDEMLVLTSGGCNALEYAIHGPKRIHCVDMNPCQGHLLELKLAGISSLPYSEFWRLFGEGFHPMFSRILDTYLSPYMTSYAYQFWKNNSDFANLYETGCSGMAIKAFRFLVHIVGLEGSVERLCSARTVADQAKIWMDEVRPHFLSRKWIGLLSTNKFAWDALGVPKRQFEMLLNEGSVFDYVAETLDPVVHKYLLSNESYFWQLGLRKRYVGNEQDQCPSYLTPAGFAKLRNTSNLNAIKIHTAPIVTVLETAVEPNSLTKVIVMDHFDWFDGEMAHEEILALSKAVRKDGKVFWRSASKKPWYSAIFVKYGFDVRPLGVRISEADRNDYKWKKEFEGLEEGCLFSECIDRVNMYASFWVATKKTSNIA